MEVRLSAKHKTNVNYGNLEFDEVEERVVKNSLDIKFS